jgi:hypothetical protein
MQYCDVPYVSFVDIAGVHLPPAIDALSLIDTQVAAALDTVAPRVRTLLESSVEWKYVQLLVCDIFWWHTLAAVTSDKHRSQRRLPHETASRIRAALGANGTTDDRADLVKKLLFHATGVDVDDETANLIVEGTVAPPPAHCFVTESSFEVVDFHVAFGRCCLHETWADATTDDLRRSQDALKLRCARWACLLQIPLRPTGPDHLRSHTGHQVSQVLADLLVRVLKSVLLAVWGSRGEALFAKCGEFVFDLLTGFPLPTAPVALVPSFTRNQNRPSRPASAASSVRQRFSPRLPTHASTVETAPPDKLRAELDNLFPKSARRLLPDEIREGPKTSLNEYDVNAGTYGPNPKPIVSLEQLSEAVDGCGVPTFRARTSKLRITPSTDDHRFRKRMHIQAMSKRALSDAHSKVEAVRQSAAIVPCPPKSDHLRGAEMERIRLRTGLQLHRDEQVLLARHASSTIADAHVKLASWQALVSRNSDTTVQQLRDIIQGTNELLSGLQNGVNVLHCSTAQFWKTYDDIVRLNRTVKQRIAFARLEGLV